MNKIEVRMSTLLAGLFAVGLAGLLAGAEADRISHNCPVCPQVDAVCSKLMENPRFGSCDVDAAGAIHTTMRWPSGFCVEKMQSGALELVQHPELKLEELRDQTCLLCSAARTQLPPVASVAPAQQPKAKPKK